ncbi:hypothetical protein GCM10018793_53080 [Streptomyces sulfonofaciens]|uniref:Uncharacterized protein n=1 Tax=Streptomyces sulfonofaciens TaxID=68272 RepID=A0A919GIE8_9ACTN|nr:hypothetical protein [Streptomyces sulfonofaciens]GHH85372.1 hypothetical protein GCM10018793_53080 [Streptomyces sulfonofaciens]
MPRFAEVPYRSSRAVPNVAEVVAARIVPPVPDEPGKETRAGAQRKEQYVSLSTSYVTGRKAAALGGTNRMGRAVARLR